MRHFQCWQCGRRATRGMVELSRGLYELPASGHDPAERYRIVSGVTKQPRAEDRTMKVNGEPLPLAPGHFDCDLCGAKIKPGERGTCVTGWPKSATEPPPWEHDYIETGPVLPHITMIRGTIEDWPADVLAHWTRRVSPLFSAGETCSQANYYTPRPYVDEYNTGSKDYGFTYVVNPGHRVCFLNWNPANEH